MTFKGSTLVQVEVGAVFEHQGEKHVVTDDTFVVKHGTIYCSPKVFEAVCKAVPSAAE